MFQFPADLPQLTSPVPFVPSLPVKFKGLVYIVCFLLGDSPASDLYMPMFWNTLSIPSSKAGAFE